MDTRPAEQSHYGAVTFLHEQALLGLIEAHGLPFDLVEFDTEALNMDIFILRRR